MQLLLLDFQRLVSGLESFHHIRFRRHGLLLSDDCIARLRQPPLDIIHDGVEFEPNFVGRNDEKKLTRSEMVNTLQHTHLSDVRAASRSRRPANSPLPSANSLR